MSFSGLPVADVEELEAVDLEASAQPAAHGHGQQRQGHKLAAEAPVSDFERDVRAVLGEIGAMLIAKNRKYGDSALNPVRFYSSASPIEQINVRIDDKLSRKASGQADEDEDIDLDLIGYLVLRRIAVKRGRA